MKIIGNEIHPGEYEFGSGIGTSVKELIAKVQEETGKFLKIEKKEYILPEAERLVASNPIISDPLPLSEGIRQVKAFVEKESSDSA